MKLRLPASGPASPQGNSHQDGGGFFKHPPFTNAPTLLSRLSVKVFLVLAPDEHGTAGHLVGIRLSLSSARLVADRYPGAEIHRFLATK